MIACVTCRRWKPMTDADRNFHEAPDGWGWCTAMHAYHDDATPGGLGGVDGARAVAVDCYGRGDRVMVATAPDFGCMAHEAKT